MVQEIKDRILIDLQKIDVLNKRMDDKIVKNIITPGEVKEVAATVRQLTQRIQKYIEIQ